MEAEGNSGQPAASSPMEHAMPVTVDRIRRSEPDRGITHMKTSEERIARRTTVPSPRRGRRLAWAVVAVLVVAFLAVLVLAGISALGVRRHLLAGRDALDRGKTDLIDGDAAAAQSEFDSAHEAFRAGADGARSIWLSIAGAIPVVGNTPDVVRAVADAGLKTADAASGIAGAVADLPGGLGALAPTDAGIPIDRLAGLTEATARADELTGQALQTLEDAPTRLVLGAGRLRTGGAPRRSSRRCTGSCTPAR